MDIHQNLNSFKEKELHDISGFLIPKDLLDHLVSVIFSGSDFWQVHFREKNIKAFTIAIEHSGWDVSPCDLKNAYSGNQKIIFSDYCIGDISLCSDFVKNIIKRNDLNISFSRVKPFQNPKRVLESFIHFQNIIPILGIKFFFWISSNKRFKELIGFLSFYRTDMAGSHPNPKKTANMAVNQHNQKKSFFKGEPSSRRVEKSDYSLNRHFRREFRTNVPLTKAQKEILDNVLTFHGAGLQGQLCKELQKIAYLFKEMNKRQQISTGKTVDKILTTNGRNTMVESMAILPEEIQDKICLEAEQKSQEQYRKILIKIMAEHFQHPRMTKIKGSNLFHTKFMSIEPLLCFDEQVRQLLDWGLLRFLIMNQETKLDFAPIILSEILHRIFTEIRIQKVIIHVTSIPPEWACYDETNSFFRYLPAIHCFTVYPEFKDKESDGYIYSEPFQHDERILESLQSVDISRTLAYHRANSIMEFQEKIAFNRKCNSDVQFINSTPHNFVFMAERRWIDFQQKDLNRFKNGDIEMSEDCARALSDLEERDRLDAYHNSLFNENDSDDFWDSLGEEGVHNLDNALEG